MNRTPEPELMQSPSQVRAYADADFSRSDSMVVKSLEKYLKKVGRTFNKTDLIFDMACGPGNISERIAKNWPFVNVVGIDGSKEMLDEAEKKLSKNITKNLSYQLIEINLNWYDILFSDSFENLNNWNVVWGDWNVDDGILRSQTDFCL